MYNKTVMDWFEEAKDDVVGFSKAKMFEIIFSVVFLVLITQGRKTWMNVLHFYMFIDGVCSFIIPERWVGQWLTGTMEDSHIVLARCVALMTICWCLGYFFSNKSTDSTLETSWMLSFFIMNFLIMMSVAYLMSHPAKKNSKVKMETDSLNFMFYTCLLTTVGTLFHLFRSKDWGGYGEIANHANFHLRIDFVLLMFMGVIDFALPQWSVRMSFDIEKVDTVHALLCRCAGATLISMAMMSTRAANFLRTSDKDAVVVSHFLYYVMTVVYTWYMCYVWQAKMTLPKIAFKAVYDFFIILNVTGALDRDMSVFKRVVINRFKAVPQDIRGLFKYKRF